MLTAEDMSTEKWQLHLAKKRSLVNWTKTEGETTVLNRFLGVLLLEEKSLSRIIKENVVSLRMGQNSKRAKWSTKQARR